MPWRIQILVVIFLLAAFTAPAAKSDTPPRALLWNPEAAGLQGWTKPHHLSCTAKDGLLHLDILKPDAWLTLEGLRLNPAEIHAFLIRYKAEAFRTQQTSGEIFFATEQAGFREDFYLSLPSLELDGAWHELLLPVDQYLRGPVDQWRKSDLIRAIRLDLVNEAPGRITIESLIAGPKLKQLEAADIELEAAPWFFLRTQDFPQTERGDWRCELLLPPGDHAIWAHAVDLPQGQAALGALTFYGAVKEPLSWQNSGRQGWRRIALLTDGHLEILLNHAPSIYFDSLVIVDGDAAPKARRLPPLRPRESSIKPLAKAAALPGESPWKAAMLAYPGALEAHPQTGFKHACFRRVFKAPKNLSEAWLQLVADDQFDLYLNGQKLASKRESSDWARPTVIEISRELHHGVENCLAVESINSGGPGGVMIDLTLNLRNGESRHLRSDTSWRASATAAEGWTRTDFDDSAWLAALAQPGPPHPPWNQNIPYEDKRPRKITLCVGSLIHGEVTPDRPQQFSLRFKSDKALQAGESIDLALRHAESDVLILEQHYPLKAANLKAEEGGAWRIEGLELTLSQWLPSMPLYADFSMPGRRLLLPAKQTRTFQFTNTRAPASLYSKVRMENGLPKLFVNNTPLYPFIANGEGRGRPGTKEAARDADFAIEALWIDPMGQPQWWRGPGEYDFTVVDQKIVASLDYNPAIYVLPIVWAAPPLWWAEAFPDEMAHFQDGETWNYYRSAHAFASPRWRADAEAALTAFVSHLEQMPYAERILGYWVIGGVSAEWQGWGAHDAHQHGRMMDYAAPAKQAFQEFLAKKYPERPGAFESAEIPSINARLDARLGLFRDPTTASSAIDYDECYSESVVDALLHCCRALKAAVADNKIVGAYFGYTLEYSNMNWALQLSGHHRLRKALDDPAIDFFAAPPSYAVRRLGEDQAWMHPFRSIQRAGKLVWVDDDTRTFLSGPAGYDPMLTLEETRAALQRNFAKAICRRAPYSFLSIQSGAELAHPTLARDLRILKHTASYLLQNEVRREAEIAVIVDEDAMKYLAPTAEKVFSGEWDTLAHWNGQTSLSKRMVNPLTGDLISYQRGRIARIGAPVDYLLFSDLPRLDKAYKLYIFLNAFQYTEALRRAVWEKLYTQAESTVLWCYAPGLIHRGRADCSNMAFLTGLRFDMIERPGPLRTLITDLGHPLTEGLHQPCIGASASVSPRFAVIDENADPLGRYLDTEKTAIAVKQIEAAQVLFYGGNKLDTAWLRQLAENAGVHIYSRSEDPFDANAQLIMLHSSAAGEKHLTLRESTDVVDVMEGRVLAVDTSDCHLHMPARSTVVLYTGASQPFLDHMRQQNAY